MIDIVIFALKADEPRAGAVLDALKARGEAGKYRTRFVATHPMDADWRADEARTEGCDCVLFCFSDAIALPDAAPFVALAARVNAAGRAIAVELDAGSLPVALAGCSTYPLNGSHANPAWLFRALFGNPYKNLIVAAATDKAEGRDPPSLSAIRGIALKQFGLRLLGVGTVVGLISSVVGIVATETVQKWWHADEGRAFAAAKETGCPSVRAFSRDTRYEGSAWQSEVTAYLAGCPAPERVVLQVDSLPLDASIPKLDMAPAPNEAQAELQGRNAAQAKCKDYVQFGGSVVSAKIETIRQQCGRIAGGFACTTDAHLTCEIKASVRMPNDGL